MRLREATPDDYPELLALNAASVAALSPLDGSRLAHLHDESELCLVLETDAIVRAFVLAMREGASYDSENYRWFDRRYPAFLYVDRVVVAAPYRGAGLGQRLYSAVFERARRDAIGLVTCEFDLDPPNPASARFHARQGFREVGRQHLAAGKVVSLQAATVDTAPA